jgi:hypothetical protein
MHCIESNLLIRYVSCIVSNYGHNSIQYGEGWSGAYATPTGLTTENTTEDNSSDSNSLISSNTRKDDTNYISYVEVQKAILYTLDHRKLLEEYKSMKSTHRRSAVPMLWKEIQHGAVTGFAWLFVFLPALFYYIHQVIPRISH